jgi:hypothetical protein
VSDHVKAVSVSSSNPNPNPGRGDLPTMPDPSRNNTGRGPHLPTMPDPTSDPERGQQLPGDAYPVNKQSPIRDPLPAEDGSEGPQKIAQAAALGATGLQGYSGMARRTTGCDTGSMQNKMKDERSRRRRKMMMSESTAPKVVGTVTSLLAGYVLVTSPPDIFRHIKIRTM